jgi:hypothetical protein
VLLITLAAIRSGATEIEKRDQIEHPNREDGDHGIVQKGPMT